MSSTCFEPRVHQQKDNRLLEPFSLGWTQGFETCGRHQKLKIKILIYKRCILFVFIVKLYYNARCKKQNKNSSFRNFLFYFFSSSSVSFSRIFLARFCFTRNLSKLAFLSLLHSSPFSLKYVRQTAYHSW